MNVDNPLPGSASNTLLRSLLLGFAFALPISISVAQPLAYLAIPIWVAGRIRNHDRSFLRNPFFWPVVVFVGLMLLAALLGPQPAYSIPRSRRLLLAMLIFMIPTAFDLESDRPLRSLLAPLLCFVAGATCLGLWDLIRVPMELRQGIALYDTGNMRDPQLFLVSSCILLAIWIYRPIRCSVWLLGGVSLISLLGVVLHFKRGVWIAFALAICIVAGLTRRYRILAYLLIGLIFLLMFPQTRDRLSLLREEFNERTGGRKVLWTEVAPELIQQYPLGAGFRSLEHEDFASVTRSYLQPGLNHLHNNLLQVLVDAGWVGGAVWLYWMLLTIGLLAQYSLRDREGTAVSRTVALGGLAAFTGLMLNGVVEYNFGNSVIYMVMMFLIGMTAAVHGQVGSAQTDRPLP